MTLTPEQIYNSQMLDRARLKAEADAKAAQATADAEFARLEREKLKANTARAERIRATREAKTAFRDSPEGRAQTAKETRKTGFSTIYQAKVKPGFDGQGGGGSGKPHGETFHHIAETLMFELAERTRDFLPQVLTGDVKKGNLAALAKIIHAARRWPKLAEMIQNAGTPVAEVSGGIGNPVIGIGDFAATRARDAMASKNPVIGLIPDNPIGIAVRIIQWDLGSKAASLVEGAGVIYDAGSFAIKTAGQAIDAAGKAVNKVYMNIASIPGSIERRIDAGINSITQPFRDAFTPKPMQTQAAAA